MNWVGLWWINFLANCVCVVMIMRCLRKFLPNFETLYFWLMLSKSWLVARNVDALINKLAILLPLNLPTCTNVDHTSLWPGSQFVCRKFLEFLRLISIPLTYRTTSYGLVTNFRGKFPPTAPPTYWLGHIGTQQAGWFLRSGPKKTPTGWPGANWVRIGHNLPGRAGLTNAQLPW